MDENNPVTKRQRGACATVGIETSTLPMRNNLLLVAQFTASGMLSKNGEIRSVYFHVHFDKG